MHVPAVIGASKEFIRSLPGRRARSDRAEIRQRSLEGIVAKLATSPYEPGKRSGAWTKFKCGYQEDFVIGG